MSRLIVISNRVARVTEGKAAAGGLAVAMLAALKASGGIWFGWSGETKASPPEQPHIHRVGRLTLQKVEISDIPDSPAFLRPNRPGWACHAPLGGGGEPGPVT